MTASQHTPGPWHMADGRKGTIWEYDIIGPNGEDIAYANPSDGADEPTLYPAHANARLIAAAPEMYEALKHAVAVDTEWRREYGDHNRTPEHQQSYDMVLAAIAKAESR